MANVDRYNNFDRTMPKIFAGEYALLFGRLGHQQWQPNLIWFDDKKDISFHIDKATAQCTVFELCGEPETENDMENPPKFILYPIKCRWKR